MNKDHRIGFLTKAERTFGNEKNDFNVSFSAPEPIMKKQLPNFAPFLSTSSKCLLNVYFLCKVI